MDLKIFLKNLPAFEDFSAQHLETFAARLNVSEYDSGHVFVRQGEQGDALYLLLQGAVNISRHDAPGGEEYEVRELPDGEMFGMLSMVNDLPAPATCTARGKVRAAMLTREEFAQLFQEVSPIAHHLQYMVAVQLARELQDTNRRYRSALKS